MKKTIWIVVIVIVLVGVAWALLTMQTAKAPDVAPGQVQGAEGENTYVDDSKDGSADTSATDTSAPEGVVVSYSSAGFSPATVTVKVGTKVTFVSKDGSPMWIGSADHPSHTKYAGTTKDQHCPDTSGTAFDQCSVGSTYSFVFEKEGTWGYHNHVNASAKGTVVVTP